MNELPIEYLRTLGEQLVLISVFLGGISITMLGTIIVHKNESNILKFMIIGLFLAAISFIVAIIGMTKVQMILAPDSPYLNKNELLHYPRLVGGLSFLMGIYTLVAVLSISGWMKSKRIGLFTTTIGVIGGILIFTLF